MSKIAVVLFNLGGPDSKQAIEPFLMNFFTDKNIIRAPYPVRWCLAKLISKKRSKQEAGESYAELGDRSPLLDNSQAQATALEKLLSKDKDNQYKVFVCMRYWHPMADEVAGQVKEFGADKVVMLPLYPQFSTTTTRSSFQAWDKAVRKHGLTAPRNGICCYPWEAGFINASVDKISKVYKQSLKKYEGKNPPRILFSAHGLPEKVVNAGDPYQWQCEQGAEKIVAALKAKDKLFENVDWQICYQSRVGPLKWIGPSTEEALKKAVEDEVPVVIYPHAFTQEHVETLVEIDIEYRELAEEWGIVGMDKVDTVGIHKAFIEGLGTLVQQSLKQEGVLPDGGVRLCPKNWSDCCQNIKGAK